MQSEIKENVQGNNSDGKETRTQFIGLEQKEEMNIQPEQNEETNFKKRKFRNIWGAGQTAQPKDPVWGNKASKLLTEKTCGG